MESTLQFTVTRQVLSMIRGPWLQRTNPLVRMRAPVALIGPWPAHTIEILIPGPLVLKSTLSIQDWSPVVLIGPWSLPVTRKTPGLLRGKKQAWGANGGETAKLRKLGVLPLRPLRAIGIALHATLLIGDPSGRAMGAETPGPACARKPNILA